METRRTLNPAMPRQLVWAQVLLYLAAVYAVGRGFAQVRFPGWELIIGGWQVLAAYGIANEGRWGWRLGVAAAVAGVLPPVNALVTDPSQLLHPDFLVLVALPVAALVALLDPVGRDHQRTWFR